MHRGINSPFGWRQATTTTTPDQFAPGQGLSAAEAASACGPAAAVAFARANGRTPTLREATDLARQVGWTEAGGMNGVANEKALLDRMGVPAELDTAATAQSIAARVKAGDLATVSTPIHYYVIDDYDPTTGQVHAGVSGQNRRGGAQWMSLDTIAARDGGINGALYASHPDAGGVTMGPNQPSTDEVGDVLASLVPSKGQPTVRAINPTIKATKHDAFGNPIAGESEDVPNPTPKYRYLFHDGTYLDVTSPPTAADGTLQGARQVIGGTAITSAAKGEAGTVVGGNSASEQFIVVHKPDGTVTQTPNPNYVAPKPGAPRTVSTPATEPYIVQEMPDGTTRQTTNPNYTAPSRTSTHQVGNHLYTLDASGNVVNHVEVPKDVPYRSPAQTAKDDVDLATARQALLPKQQQILQAHTDTVKYIQGMLERGEIEPSQADAYVQLSKQAAEAGLRGSTPFDEMDARRKADQAQQDMGIKLINQRVSSGASLASSLMSSAMGPNVMLRPGQTSLGIDPLAGLLPIIERLQGGPQVNQMAQGMLAGAAPGGAAPPPPGGSMPAGL